MTSEQPSSQNSSTIVDWAAFRADGAQDSAQQVGKPYEGKNKRRHPRYTINAQVNVWLDNGIILEGAAKDISLRGVWFECGSCIPLGNPVRVDIVSRKRGGAALAAKISGSVVRISEGGLAVAFDMLDTEQSEAVEALVGAAAAGET